MMSSAEAATIPKPKGKTPSAGLTAWQQFTFSLTHAGVGFLLILLTLPGLYRFGRIFGTLEWTIDFKRRRRFGKTLRRILERKPTGSERRRATREFFAQARCAKLFYLVFDRIPREQAKSLLSISNQELLDQAVAAGRGVYVAMSHHGAHHVIAMLLALRGYKVALVRDPNEGAMRRYVQGRFDQHFPEFKQMRVIFADAYPREIYRCLKDGYMLGSAMDVNRVRDDKQKTQEVTVFGQKRPILTGPLHIAVRCKTPVIQAFVVPEPGFRFRLEITGRLIDPERVQDEEAAVEEAATVYAETLERVLKETPSLLTKL